MGQFLHIEMWTKTWSKTNSSGEFVNQNTPTGKTKFTNVASKDTTLRPTQVFSTLPYTYGENENMEIWKYFFWKKLEILNVIFVPKF